MVYLGSIFPNAKRLSYNKAGLSLVRCQPIFMIKYPKLKFIINPDKEVEVYFSFLSDAQYRNLDREMGWAFFIPHPKLKILKKKNLSEKERRKIIQNYVDSYYKKHLTQIKRNTLLIKKQWREHEKNFFVLVNKIFKNYTWPKGKYIAYPTIWGMYPRDIKNKILWFPFKHKIKNYPVVVIAHEMLHFIFYDYLYKYYPKYLAPKYDLKIWDISEAFNIIIQDSPEWLKIFKIGSMPYLEHRKLIKKMRQIWQEKQDIDYLLNKVLPK